MQDWESIDDVRDDYIDSRDIIDWLEAWDEDEDHDEDQTELRAILQEVNEDGETNCGDWRYGETLIRDDCFEDYARELAEDIGAIDPDASWPNTFIDWEAAADALKMDYTSIRIGEVEYWGRT